MYFGRNRASNVLTYVTNGILYDQNDLFNHKNGVMCFNIDQLSSILDY